MKLFLVIGIVGALLGGVAGWIRSTRDMSRRSFDPLDQAFPSGRSQAPEFRRRVRHRIVMTLLYAVLGVIAMFVAVALFARFG